MAHATPVAHTLLQRRGGQQDTNSRDKRQGVRGRVVQVKRQPRRLQREGRPTLCREHGPALSQVQQGHACSQVEGVTHADRASAGNRKSHAAEYQDNAQSKACQRHGVNGRHTVTLTTKPAACSAVATPADVNPIMRTLRTGWLVSKRDKHSSRKVIARMQDNKQRVGVSL